MDKMEQYISGISAVLEKNINERKELTRTLISACTDDRNITSITIVASGSSLNAVRCAIPFMNSLMDVRLNLITPFEFLHYEQFDDTSKYLFVSQSGGSTNVLAAVRKAKTEGIHTTLITANVDSAIAREADHVVSYGAGEETVGYVTKGVSSMILFFMLFALEYAGESIGEAAYTHILNQLKTASRHHHLIYGHAYSFCEKYRDDLLTMNHVFVLACGSNMGTAAEAALKLSEMVHVQTSVYEIEEFIHGPDLQLTPDYTLFFIDGGDAAGKRVCQIYEASREITSNSYLISTGELTPVEEKYSPLCLLAFFQYLAYWTAKELDIRDEHPLYEGFEKRVASKVDEYCEDAPF